MPRAARAVTGSACFARRDTSPKGSAVLQPDGVFTARGGGRSVPLQASGGATVVGVPGATDRVPGAIGCAPDPAAPARRASPAPPVAPVTGSGRAGTSGA